ncbi:protein sel-1 homolog 3-like isoform X1 [Seriola lalandi dorsalis]|uniref:protein sel-1 homolog 3-like isoform X1 n=1 Tax=Seriola lalandi dorsalis TaxID=1841481 RepID=UPI000C6F6F87|nr:protein sel-1 homolog 3-like isoform X1 [Seriola lalandi dorsalis]
MTVSHAIIFGYVLTAAVIMGECVLQASSSQSAESLHDNFIGFDSAPDKVVDGSAVRVRYQCSRPCQLAVEVVASTLRKTDLLVFRRKWISSTPRVLRIHQVMLRLPPSILYQHDFFNRNDLEAENVTVRAWLHHLKDIREPGTYHGSMLKIYKVLQVTPPSQRPTKPHTECPSWSAHLVWQVSKDRISQCPHESDVIDVLKFPLASTGEHFGVVRRFQPFMDGGLERVRLHAVTQPSVALSVWIYLLERCQRKLCGIIHHLDRKNAFDSVLMQLTDTGDVIIQARVTTGEDEAFQARVALPLWKWIRLDCYIRDSKVLLYTTWDDETRRYEYEFQDSIYYDDTDGYFVIGGSKYMPGIHGYYGPIKYYRLGTEEVKFLLSNKTQIKTHLNPEATLQELDKTHRECQEIKRFTKAFLREVTERHLLSTISKDVCKPHFIRLWGQFGEKICTQTWSWETPLKHSSLFHLLQKKEEEGGSLSIKQLRTALFQEAVATMFPVDQEQIKVTSQSMSLLQVSSCFGNHKASLLLASVLLSGLGHTVDQQQAHVYSLIGASGDDRFALMHAGYKHTQGIDGFPKDLDMAYSYYSNAAAQSSTDSSNIHDTEQYTPEHIYLSNQEDLNSLTHESSDVFHYLKLQAERGDAESQRRLGLMLYWGQNGVSKDIVSALKWFERSAMQMKDPSAMYDYSILLMKGEGVKRNFTRGFQLLKKAAAMGSINALNGLGWYHGIVLNDHRNAVKYFEQAALNGSDDGMFNLGVYHLGGKNPHNPQRNEMAAFQQFLNASRFGHVAASVEAAWYLSTGSLKGVSQDVERAVIMLKKVCEQNGHLGFMIREALQAYLQGSWQEAFVKYVLAAETGLGLAQSNAAHLCEVHELNLSYDCQWRYHNYSILNYDPHQSALLKMGDYYYYSSSMQEDSLSLVGQAVSMYSRAALAGSPQGMYNLVVLVQQGHVLPLSVRGLFNVSHHDQKDAVVEKMLKRCVETESEDAVTPCSLALLGVQMGKALRRMTQNGAQLLLVYASLLSVCVLIVTVPFQSCLEQRAPRRRAVEVRARTSFVSQDAVNLNRQQDGIMGRTYRVAGNLWLTILNGERWLRQTSDLAVTLSGVCLFAFWTTFLYHLL